MTIKTLLSLPAATNQYQAWTRPTDWLPLPTVNVGDQKVVALAAVFNSPATASNLFVVNCSGAYVVDWGDGTVENVASATARSHQYNYAALPANDTAEGFRQAVVTITPQAGQTLTQVLMNGTPAGASSQYYVQWRDVKVAGSSLTSVNFGNNSFLGNALYCFEFVGTSAMTSVVNASPMFARCGNLRKVIGTQWTSQISNFQQMFLACSMLETVALFDTTAAQDMTQMFNACTRLRTVPLFNTSSVTSMAQMFQNCANLVSVPLFDTTNVVSMSQMFNNCVSLITIPLFNTAKVTTFLQTFQGCTTLASIPALNTGKCINFNAMFSACVSLITMPATLNTALGTDFSSMFANCTSLQSHPAMDVSSGTLFNSMFNVCILLQVVNLPTSGLGTTFTGMVNSCNSLRSITLNMTSASSQTNANLWNAGNNLVALITLIMTGLRFAPLTAWIANNQLDASALNAMYTSLGTASGAQSISVSGNPGTATDNPTIATAKGWTITGT